MISEQTDAIVLRMHSWSETSLIGSLYTRDYGKVSVLAKGARRPKSPFEAALDLLSVCRVLFIAKPGGSLSLLTEAKLIKRFHHTGRNLQRLYAAYYLVELLEKFTEQGFDEFHREKLGDQQGRFIRFDRSHLVTRQTLVSTTKSDQTELFDLAYDTLRQLERAEGDVRAIVLRLELQLLRISGHAPSLRSCVHCGNGISGGGWVIYSPVSCGVLCTGCSTGVRFLMRIPRSVCDLLERFSTSDWRSVSLDNYTQDNRAAIRTMMLKTITNLVDQKLKLQPYLEELRR